VQLFQPSIMHIVEIVSSIRMLSTNAHVTGMRGLRLNSRAGRSWVVDTYHHCN